MKNLTEEKNQIKFVVLELEKINFLLNEILRKEISLNYIKIDNLNDNNGEIYLSSNQEINKKYEK